MENELTIELDYQKNPRAQEDESAALRQIARLFTEKILKTAELELGLSEKDEVGDDKRDRTIINP